MEQTKKREEGENGKKRKETLHKSATSTFLANGDAGRLGPPKIKKMLKYSVLFCVFVWWTDGGWLYVEGLGDVGMAASSHLANTSLHLNPHRAEVVGEGSE